MESGIVSLMKWPRNWRHSLIMTDIIVITVGQWKNNDIWLHPLPALLVLCSHTSPAQGVIVNPLTEEGLAHIANRRKWFLVHKGSYRFQIPFQSRFYSFQNPLETNIVYV